MVRYPPPGLEDKCKAKVIDSALFKLAQGDEVPTTSRLSDGVSTPVTAGNLNSKDWTDNPAPFEGAAEALNELLLQPLGIDGTEPIQKQLGRQIRKVQQSQEFKEAGGTVAPAEFTHLPTGVSYGASVANPKGDISAKTIDWSQVSFIQYASDERNAWQCAIGIQTANTLSADLDDHSYGGSLGYNGSLSLTYISGVRTRFVVGAMFGGNFGYGADGKGFGSIPGDGSTTVFAMFDAN